MPTRSTLKLHGLEFARVRQGFVSDSFARQCQCDSRCRRNETPLLQDTEERLRGSDAAALRRVDIKEGSARDPLFRLQPEAWLESTLAGDLTAD